MKHLRAKFLISLTAAIFSPSVFVLAQTAPGEHEQHHPQANSPASPSPMAGMPAPTPNADAPGGGMGGGMREMMNQMGKPPQKELYPSLIELPPNLTPEKRAEIQRLAEERIKEGNALLNQAREKMSKPEAEAQPAALQEATAQMRQGLALLESGLAAQRALAGNNKTQDTAFKWFRGEMNLAPSDAEVEEPHGFFGLSWFHYISMLTLAAFSGAMVWMYFRKMKRANALAARLTGGVANTPPPAVTSSIPIQQGPLTEPVNVNLNIAPSKANSWSGTLLVSKIFEETPQVKTFRLTDPAGGKIPFNYLPGQFITTTVVPNGLPVKRSYTIASSPTNRDYCEITVKHEQQGTVSHYLNTQVHEGELLQMTGPSGKFTFTGQEADSVVLIAGGVGVTPLMSIVRYLTDRSWKGDIYFFFGCLSESDIIFREEIEYLQKRYPNLHVTMMLEETGENSTNSYLSGLITKEILTERVPGIASRRIHVCGPPPMIDAVKQMLDELDVLKENVKTEIFVGKLPSPKVSPLAPAEPGETSVATFALSNKTAVLPPEKTILEAAEEVGVNIDYSCRIGICGICKVKLLSGSVTMEIDEALTDEDKEQNIILACQAKATGDVAVDA